MTCLVNLVWSNRFERPDSMTMTIVDEFNLFCEREYLLTVSTTLFFVGVGIGCFRHFSSHFQHMCYQSENVWINKSLQFLGDIFGRLRTGIALVFLNSATNYAMSYADTFWQWTMLQIFTHSSFRDASLFHFGWLFGKVPKGGRGPFLIQKF